MQSILELIGTCSFTCLPWHEISFPFYYAGYTLPDRPRWVIITGWRVKNICKCLIFCQHTTTLWYQAMYNVIVNIKFNSRSSVQHFHRTCIKSDGSNFRYKYAFNKMYLIHNIQSYIYMQYMPFILFSIFRRSSIKL